MKVAVLGSGGREHALVWKMSQSERIKAVSYTHLTLPTTLQV